MKQPPRVLIVDDNQPDIYLARYYLEKADCYGPICDVDSGIEALRLFQDPEPTRKQHPDCFPPALILLDINMPRMNGFQFLEELEKLQSYEAEELVVIMLTSSNSEQDRRMAERFPVVKGFHVKPMSLMAARSLAEEHFPSS